LTLGEPDARRGDSDERLEALVEFVIARCDSAEVFDTTKEALDKVAALVNVAIKGARPGSVGARGDDRLRTAGRDGVDQGLGVVSLVGSNRFGRDAVEQRRGYGHVGRLSGCQAPPREVAEGFDQGMDFCGQPPARPANRLGALFLGAPAAC
jgi:hypothetical protein